MKIMIKTDKKYTIDDIKRIIWSINFKELKLSSKQFLHDECGREVAKITIKDKDIIKREKLEAKLEKLKSKNWSTLG